MELRALRDGTMCLDRLSGGDRQATCLVGSGLCSSLSPVRGSPRAAGSPPSLVSCSPAEGGRHGRCGHCRGGVGGAFVNPCCFLSRDRGDCAVLLVCLGADIHSVGVEGGTPTMSSRRRTRSRLDVRAERVDAAAQRAQNHRQKHVCFCLF